MSVVRVIVGVYVGQVVPEPWDVVCTTLGEAQGDSQEDHEVRSMEDVSVGPGQRGYPLQTCHILLHHLIQTIVLVTAI